MVGLRGVGKTVLLNRLRDNADAGGVATVFIEAPERKSLPALLAPPLRAALLKLDRLKQAGDKAKLALRALGSLISAAKAKYRDIEFGFDIATKTGLADTGDLDSDLTELLQTVGEAARERETAFALYIDELQYVEEAQLAALISALHRCSQTQLPVTLVGAGLPQLVGRTGRAKSYAERLFDFPVIGPLAPTDAMEALAKPAKELGVSFSPDALARIIEETEAYPYFLQEWGKHSWDVATHSPIELRDVEEAGKRAVEQLDASFFRVRFDRLTPAEKRYLEAMAQLGPGPHRSGDIANHLKVKVSSAAPTRGTLIEKGMIYSPAHGDTVFTVPLFDGFMHRIMKGE